MKAAKPTTWEIALPQGASASISNNIISISGPKGKNSRRLQLSGVEIKIEGGKIAITGPLREANTARAHIANMLRGSTEGYIQKMKVIYAHFPISLEAKGKEFVIKNFVGEKQPRKANICGDTKIEVKAPIITVSGPCKEDVFQTVANIRTATKIRERDSRVFQDGIYPVDE